MLSSEFTVSCLTHTTPLQRPLGGPAIRTGLLNLGCWGNDLRWGFYAVDWNRLSGGGGHDWLVITWWKERLEASCVQEGRCEGRKGVKERKTSGLKPFSELARPLTSAYVWLCGRRVRAHPASSAAIKLPSPTRVAGQQVSDGLWWVLGAKL